MIANAASALRRPGADVALLTTNPSSTCFGPDRGGGFSPSRYRELFFRVSHWGKRNFQQDGKAALSSGHVCAKSSSRPSPGRLHAPSTHKSARATTQEEQLGWDSALQRATQKSWAEVILKFGSPRGSVKEAARPAKHESNYTVLCTHGLSNSAANIKSSRTRSCITHLGISSRKSDLP